jgi:hypothetical protein
LVINIAEDVSDTFSPKIYFVNIVGYSSGLLQLKENSRKKRAKKKQITVL